MCDITYMALVGSEWNYGQTSDIFRPFIQFSEQRLMCSIKISGQAILWLYCHNHYHALTWIRYDSGTENHLCGGVMSTFVFLLSTIAQVLALAVQSGLAHKNSDQTFVIAMVHWRLCANTHPCGEVVSAVIIFLSLLWPPLHSRSTRGHHVTCIN